MPLFWAILIVFFTGVLAAKAGSLTPSTAPGSTMRTLEEIFNTLAGTYDSTAQTASINGNVSQQLKYIAGLSLQNIYNNSSTATITTTDGKNLTFSLADTTTDAKFIVDILGTGNTFEVRDNGAAVFTIADGGLATFTGNVTVPSFTLGSTSVTATGAQLNYLSSATGTTGTNSTNLVFSTSPVLTTPNIGAATATSIAIGLNTLDTTEWAYLDGVNQTLATTSTPQFARAGLGAAADATNILTVTSSSSTDASKAVNVATTNAATTGNTAYSLYNALTSSAVVTGTAQNLYGAYNSVTKTGADTSTATTTLYGIYGAASDTGHTNVANIRNTYGGYFVATGSNPGATSASTAVGLYATASGADNNYAAIFENGNVGIGTTDARNTLTVGAPIATDASTAEITSSATNTSALTIRSAYGTSVPLLQVFDYNAGLPSYGFYRDYAITRLTDSGTAQRFSNDFITTWNPSGNVTNDKINIGSSSVTTGTKDFSRINGIYISDSHVGTGTVTALNGILSFPSLNSSGTIITLSGVYGRPKNLSTGTVNNMAAFYAGIENSGAGTVDNGYGIYLAANQGTFGNSFGVYQVGSSDINYFAGSVGIGDATPDATLDIDSTATTGDAFGVLASTLTTGRAMLSTATIASTTAAASGYNLYLSTANSNSTNANTSYGIYNATTDAVALGNTNYGSYTSVANTGAITTQTKNIYGSYISASGTGGITTTPTTNVYGEYITTTATHGGDVGTVNQYGLYIANGTSSTNGTSTKYGIYIEQPIGADTNAAISFAGRTSLHDDSATFTILPAAGDYVRIGDAGTHSQLGTPANDDLFVSGKLEVDGAAYLDAGLTTTTGVFGGALSGITTLGMSGDLTMSGNVVNITHSGTTSLTIASTSGTVGVESVVFTGGAISSATSIAMGGALSGVTTLSMAGDLTDYEATNDANPAFLLGSAAAESLSIQANYSAGTQTLANVTFTTATASATADMGQFKFNVDGSEIARIDDDGLEVAGGGLFTFTGTTTDALTITATSLSSGSAIVATGPSGATAGVTDALVKLTSDIGNIGTANGLISSTATIDSTAASANGVNLYLSTANSNSTNANTSYGIYNATTDAVALANTNYGSYTSVANTGAIDSAITKTVYGSYISASGTLAAPTTAGITNVYGEYITTTATHAGNFGTVNNYGLYIANGTSSTNGTSTKYGIYVESPTGADTNVPIYALYNAEGGTAASNKPAIQLVNTTDAISGTQQMSPSIFFRGEGYDTDGSSETADWQIYTLPVEAATITSKLNFDSSISGAAFGNKMNLTSAGNLTISGNNILNNSGAGNFAGLDSRASLGETGYAWAFTSQHISLPLLVASNNYDAAAATAVKIGSLRTYSTAGAKLVGFWNNGTEKAYIDLNGGITIAGGQTTQDILTLTATSLSTGSAIVATGPSGATAGVTDALVKLTSDIGNMGATTPTIGLISSTATIDTSGVTTDTGVNLYLSTANSNSTNANTSYGIYNTTTDAVALANTNYGAYTSVANTGAINSAITKTIYGSYISASGTLAAPTTAGTTNVYGEYITTTATHAGNFGTVNNYGLYIANGTSSTNGTSTKYGIYVETPTLADNNYAAVFAGGNVGIGTTTPGTILEVAGGTFRIRGHGDPTSLDGIEMLYFTDVEQGAGNGAGYLLAYQRTATAGYRKLNIDASTLSLNSGSAGSVGIGDTTPDATLDIDSAATTGDAFGVLASTLTTGRAMLSAATIASTTAAASGYNLYLSTANSNSTNANTSYGIYNTTTDAVALANTNYGSYTSVANTGAINSAITKTIYGSYITASGTLAAPTTAGTTNVYGEYITTTATHAGNFGTVNNYGLYIANGTSSTNGTSTKYGLYVAGQTGADTNIGAYFQETSLGTTTKQTLQLVNETAAANSAQQISPSLFFRGYGWKTDATNASQSTDWQIYTLPVQGTSAPTSQLVFQSSINGGAYSDIAWFNSGGNVFLPYNTSSKLYIGPTTTYPSIAQSGTMLVISQNNTNASAVTAISMNGGERLNGSTGSQTFMDILPWVVETGTAGFTALKISPTFGGGLGTGANALLDLRTVTSGTSWYKFGLGNLATTGAFNSSSAAEYGVTLTPIVNQTGTASFATLYVNPTLTAAPTSYGVYTNIADAVVAGDTNYGLYTVVANTGAITTQTKNIYGSYISASGTLGTTTTPTTNVYGEYITITATHATDVGTVNNYGLYVANGTSSTNGTSTKYGIYVAAQTGADSNVTGWFGGTVGINETAATLAAANIPAGSFVVGNGAVCVDDSGSNCDDSARAAGIIYATGAVVNPLDLAENYPVQDETLVAGELVVVDAKMADVCLEKGDAPDGTKTCVKTSQESVPFAGRAGDVGQENKKLLGIVSTQPGMTLGGFGDDKYFNYKKVPVALVGRVPVKVNLEGGVIVSGDPLTLSSAAGAAKKAKQAGMIIGYALEDYNGATDENKGQVLVFVQPGVWFPTDFFDTINNASLNNNNSGLSFGAVLSGLRDLGLVVEDGIVRVKELVAEKITAKKLCLGETCVTETELKILLEKAQTPPAPATAPAVEQPPAEQPPAALSSPGDASLSPETPTAQPPVVEPLPSEPVAETPPVETPPVVETPPAETPPVVEAPPAEAPVVEAPVETPPVIETPVETPLAETPTP